MAYREPNLSLQPQEPNFEPLFKRARELGRQFAHHQEARVMSVLSDEPLVVGDAVYVDGRYVGNVVEMNNNGIS